MSKSRRFAVVAGLVPYRRWEQGWPDVSKSSRSSHPNPTSTASRRKRTRQRSLRKSRVQRQKLRKRKSHTLRGVRCELRNDSRSRRTSPRHGDPI